MTNHQQTIILKSYEDIKKEFELKNFKIINPIMFGTMNFEGNLILRSRQDFVTTHENMTFLKYNKKLDEFIETSFIKTWLKDAYLRFYDKIDFLPMQHTPKNIYNTFKGYEAEHKELFDVNINESLIMKHIKNLCNNEESGFNYVIKFLARKLQKPHELTNTALIFKSEQGAGKDLFFNYFGHQILGRNYYQNIEDTNLLFGQFNSTLENKILIVLNETSGKNTFQINEKIKYAITTDINTIEHKGLKPYNNTNHTAYIFLTNNDNPVKVPPNDRRFCGIECNNEVCNNSQYFNELRAEMKSGKYDKAFFNYLMSIDCDNYDFTNNRPLTKFYDEMKEANTPPIAKFYEDLTDDYTENIIKIQSSTLFNLFNTYLKNNNYKYDYTPNKFGLESKRLPSITTIKNNNIYYVINILELRQDLTKKYNIIFSNEDEPTKINNNEIPKEEPTKNNNEGIFNEGSGLDELITDGNDSNDVSHFK